MSETAKVRIVGWARYIGKRSTMFRPEMKVLGGGALDGVTFHRENWRAVADEKAAQMLRHLAQTKNWVADRHDRTDPDPPEVLKDSEWEWCQNDGKQPTAEMPTDSVLVWKDFTAVGPLPKIGVNKGASAGTHGSRVFEVVV